MRRWHFCKWLTLRCDVGSMYPGQWFGLTSRLSLLYLLYRAPLDPPEGL
jgi:hypothetical protein